MSDIRIQAAIYTTTYSKESGKEEFTYREYCERGRFTLHREDGPALISEIDQNGLKTGMHKEWWIEGHLHRIDGPAIEYSNGDSGT